MNERPQPERGWQILNEYAGMIVDNAAAQKFTADARDLEFVFTRGVCTEREYRTLLESILPTQAREELYERIADLAVRDLYGGLDLAELLTIAEVGAKCEAGLSSPKPEVTHLNAAIQREIVQRKAAA